VRRCGPFGSSGGHAEEMSFAFCFFRCIFLGDKRKKSNKNQKSTLFLGKSGLQ